MITSTAVLCRPLPRATPISVYQQGSGEDPQDYQQQYRQPVQYNPQLVSQVKPVPRALYKGQQQEQDPNLLQQQENVDYEV